MKLRVVFSLLAGAGLAFASNGSSGCLCTSDDGCWPSASTFAQLQSQVSQPLIYPHPTAYACYPISNPSGNCTEVEENYAYGNWRASMPGSMETPNFETFMFENGTISACYLNTTLQGTCGQGSVSVIGVDVRNVEDIQAAVNFAVKYNLKLVVKNTGHDFLGRSTARGSFVIWTHNMKNITYNPAFVPQGAPANETYDAVTLGAGVQWHEAYDAVNQYGRMMVGGLTPGGSIGAAGGWLAGGGHSASLSPTYGLGVDNAVEISVVLSTGDYVTTNEHQYSDLFWALRGGGGSTYGIVTSVTYRTYPSLPVQMYFFQANFTNATAMEELVAELMYYQIQFTDNGWGGFGSMTNTSLYFLCTTPNISPAANASTRAWTDYAESLEPYGVSSEAETYSFSSWYDWYTTLFSEGPADGTNLMFTSRLLSRETLENNYKNVTKLLVECQASFNMVAGGKVNQIDPDSAGLNPAWRNAIIETVCGFSWEDGTSQEELQANITQLKSWINTMHDLTPNDGAYFNEASLFEVDWQYTFFGEHYSTLKAIKDKYDPYRIFVVHEGVGADDWNKELTCRY